MGISYWRKALRSPRNGVELRTNARVREITLHPDGQLRVDDLPVIEQYELECGIMVLGTAGGVVLMNLTEFHLQRGDL